MPYIQLNPSGYKSSTEMMNLIKYIISDEKQVDSRLVGGNMILSDSCEHVFNQMLAVKRKYDKINGRYMRHLTISPSSYELQFLDIPQLYFLAQQICNLFLGYQTVFAIHQNTGRLHIHIAINTVSFLDGRKLTIHLSELRSAIQNLFSIYVPPIKLQNAGRQEYQTLTFAELV